MLLSVYSNARRASVPEAAVWLSRPCVFPQPRPQTFPEALSELCLKPRRAAQSPWSAGRRLFPQPSACGGKATNRCRAQRGTDTIFFLSFLCILVINSSYSFFLTIYSFKASPQQPCYVHTICAQPATEQLSKGSCIANCGSSLTITLMNYEAGH